MELDDLKKSWTTFDRQLQKRELIDEKQIEALIAGHQSGVKKGLNWFSNLHKISLWVGVVCVVVLAVVWAINPQSLAFLCLSTKGAVMIGYIVASLLFGFLWDWRTYAFSRSIDIYEMSTVEVIRRVNTFRKKIRYELVMVCVWILVFLALYYWVLDYHTQPLVVQLVFLLTFFVLIAALMYFLYAKLIYKRLSEIEKNLKELNELKSEK